MPAKHAPREAVSARFLAELAEAQPHLQAVARRLCRSHDSAKDLVQDTSERALNNAKRLHAGTCTRAWLTTMMHRLFVDQCRAKTRQPGEQPIDEDEVAAPVLQDAPWWTHVTVSDLRAAADQLDPSFAEVYRLSTFSKMSYAEIAKHLDIQKMTVGTRLIRARRKLREILRAKHGQQESK